jgi:serine/threonine protein phosphatase PrpC
MKIEETAENENRFNRLTSSQEATTQQLSLLKVAQDHLKKQSSEIEGDTTFVQTYIQGEILCGVSVGDAKIFIMRPNADKKWECLDLSQDARGLADPTDSGGRLSGKSGAYPELDGIKAVSFQLQKGDIVMISSDGVSDCFDPANLKDGSEKMEANMSTVLNGCSNAEDIQGKITDYLQEKTIEEKMKFFTTNKGKFPHQTGWGKMDNANMAFFTYS